jgi:hypothetical protein
MASFPPDDWDEEVVAAAGGGDRLHLILIFTLFIILPAFALGFILGAWLW